MFVLSKTGEWYNAAIFWPKPAPPMRRRGVSDIRYSVVGNVNGGGKMCQVAV
jgi:hypothetical protein